MKVKWYILILCFLLVPSAVRSEDRIHVHVDYNHLFGLYEKYKYWTINGFEYSMNGFDLGITGMYTVNRRLSAGVGIAAGRLSNPGYTFFPVYATVNYAPLKRTVKPYLFVKTGYAVRTKISNPGLLFSSGIGYKLKFREHFGLNFTLGYHLTQLMNDMAIYEVIDYGDGIFVLNDTGVIDRSAVFRHSVALGVGFVF